MLVAFLPLVGLAACETPSATVATEVALPVSLTPLPASIAYSSSPTAEVVNSTYLSPSEKWVSFTHAKQVYRFEYPENWFVSYQSSGQIVTLSNFPLTQVEKTIDSPNRFRLDIYSSGDFEGYTSLITFADAQKQPGSPEKVIAEATEQLDNGYLVLWRDTTTPLNQIFFEVWLTNSQTVYQLVTPSVNEQFSVLRERIVKSFVILKP